MQMKIFLKRLLPIIFIFILWIIGSKFVNPLFLPKIENVYYSFTELFKNGMLINGFYYSFIRITMATFLSMFCSLIISMLIINIKFLDDLISSITGFLRYLPITAFYPLFVMWFGIEETMKINFLFLATFVYFLPSVLLSMKEVDQNLIDTAYTIGIKKYQITYKVILPYCLPNICKTFLMMYGIGWTYIAMAETTNAIFGLGHLINVSTARGRTDQVFVVLFIIIMFSYLFDTILNKLIEKVFKWEYIK